MQLGQSNKASVILGCVFRCLWRFEMNEVFEPWLMRSGCHGITLSGFIKRGMSTMEGFKATALEQLLPVQPDVWN